MRNPWSLYDTLIEGVDPTWKVSHFSLGASWCEVCSGPHTGVAMTIRERGPGKQFPDPYDDMSLRDMAVMAKSWNFREASLGVAALNCYYNTVGKVGALGGFGNLEIRPGKTDDAARTELNAFIAFQDEIVDKKVAVIGHFPHIENQIGAVSDLIILERNPQKGDYPDSSCEYLIPEQDYLFMTGSTLINKTLPRLLELAGEKVKVCIVGPSTCMAPALFDFGADNLSGFCATDQEGVDLAIRRADVFSLFQAGYMASVGSR
jgi:uncharacterized protein (DUF4213/DUF364 family)